METYHDIYDRVAKRCLMLSKPAIIRFINGIFGTHHALNSPVDYNWTEHTDDDLKRTLADTIITINHRFSYHIEFQIMVDGSIAFRILEYGFHHAMKNRKYNSEENVLIFPEPVLIYLYEGQHQPDNQTLTIRFGEQGEFHYKIPTIKYLTLSQKELEQKKLIILIPFQILRLRNTFERSRSEENLEKLKSLVQHDIIEVINLNLRAGNITTTDAQKLRRLTQQLFHAVYDKYPEVAQEGVDEEVDEALILDVDIVEHEVTQRVTKEVTEKVTKNVTKEVTEKVTQKLTQEFSRQLDQKDAEIAVYKMLMKGYPIDEIAAKTGLTPEEIEQLKNEQ